MERNDALNLICHHYRLLTQIKPKVDCSTPVSYYSSPKSIHYVPFALRKSSSLSNLARPKNGIDNRSKKKGRDALDDFVLTTNIPKITAEYRLNSFNLLARRNYLVKESREQTHRSNPINSVNKLRLTDLKNLKLTETNNYRRESNSINIRNTQTNQISQTSQNRQNEANVNSEAILSKINRIKTARNIYDKFKEDCLNSILEKNTFSDRMILLAINEAMEQNVQILSSADMDNVFKEICSELGVNSDLIVKGDAKNHVYLPQKPPRSSGSSSSKSSGISSSSSSASNRQLKLRSSSSSGSKQNDKVDRFVKIAKSVSDLSSLSSIHSEEEDSKSSDSSSESSSSS